ncbi:MAG: flagellar basal body P-ring formation chaperone FlgA [Rhodocyclaceae bacterium]
MTIRHTLLLAALLALTNPAQAVTPEQIRDLAQRWVEDHTRQLPGQVRVNVAPMRDQQQFLARCETPEVFLPQGQQAWGRFTVGVRCTGNARALPVMLTGQVQVTGRYLVASRSLSGGQDIVEADLQWAEGELTRHPADLITRLEQAIGRNTRQAISRTQPLRASYLLSSIQIRAGQDVTVVARGNGFSVQNNGRALNTAGQGELVRVKMGNGRVISGVLRGEGTVVVEE